MTCIGFEEVIGLNGIDEKIDITSNNLYTNLNNEILINSNINSNFTIYSCNQLSNLIQPQLDERSNLIYIDSNLNTIIKLTSQNPYYPIYGDTKCINFYTIENECKTRISQDGDFEVYHPFQPIPIEYPPAWWNVHDKLAFIIQEEIGLRFDVVNLQLASGTGTITNEAEATAAAIASGAGLLGLGATTGAVGTAIAGGDYGSVAVGAGAGALFSVLGYLSYQAQVGCNLSNLGFSNQFSNVNSNMSNANLLLASNLYSISRAQGFINCNILSQQFVNNLKVSSLNLNAGNITNLNTINGTTGIFGSISTTNNGNEAIPSTNSFGGIGDKIIIKTGTSTTYPSSIGIENNALWISGQDNINFYNRGNKTLSLTSNKSTEIFGELLCNSNIKLNQINISNIFVASNVLDTTSNILSNLTFNSSNNNSIYTSNSSNILSNLTFNSFNNNSIYTFNSSNILSNLTFNSSNNNSIYTSNSSNINSNYTFNSSNSNFNYTSNSLFSNLKPIYASSNAVKDIIINETPQVNKKSAFYCLTNNVIYINGGNTPYYAYHIDLRNYTKTGYIQIGSGSGDTYRIFTIKAFFGSSYFQKLTNGIPDICEYTIYMSNKANAGGSGTIAGVNIQAIGVPVNPFLKNSVNNNLFILRSGVADFNYISIVSTSSADCRIFVEDLLN
jgi:hypothetical protein